MSLAEKGLFLAKIVKVYILKGFHFILDLKYSIKKKGWSPSSHEALDLPLVFIFMTAMNRCPCGYLGDPKHECYYQCLNEPAQIREYCAINDDIGQFTPTSDGTIFPLRLCF